ncbi:MAG: hypothetical protein D6769_01660, partial [Methanobacteriota archaeon]
MMLNLPFTNNSVANTTAVDYSSVQINGTVNTSTVVFNETGGPYGFGSYDFNGIHGSGIYFGESEALNSNNFTVL